MFTLETKSQTRYNDIVCPHAWVGAGGNEKPDIKFVWPYYNQHLW